jgi:hypothetical protein
MLHHLCKIPVTGIKLLYLIQMKVLICLFICFILSFVTASTTQIQTSASLQNTAQTATPNALRRQLLSGQRVVPNVHVNAVRTVPVQRMPSVIQ